MSNRKPGASEKKPRALMHSMISSDLPENKTDWVLMTAVSRHICINKALFAEYKEGADGECVELLSGRTVEVVGKGTVVLKLKDGKTLSMRDVLYVPCMVRNMVSVGLLGKAGLEVSIGGGGLITRNGEFVGRANIKDYLIVLDVDYDIIC